MIIYKITNYVIRYAITNDGIKFEIKNDLIKYAIKYDVINKKINNNFVFPNTPPQLLLDDSCLFYKDSIGRGFETSVSEFVQD